MIHRVLLGAIERFFAILLEHYAGNLPLWLAPVQVEIIPVSDDCLEYARGICRELMAVGIRAEVDGSATTVNYRIRNAELRKIPYMAIVGKREVEERKMAIRRHGTGNMGSLTKEQLITHIQELV
jgi:threonyl-tRNA synthetase